jgi:hypothetical protein
MVMAVAFLQSASSVGAKVAAALVLSYTTAAALGREAGSGAVNDWGGGVPKASRRKSCGSARFAAQPLPGMLRDAVRNGATLIFLA